MKLKRQITLKRGPCLLYLRNYDIQVRLIDGIFADIKARLVLLDCTVKKRVDNVTHWDVVFEPVLPSIATKQKRRREERASDVR